MGMAHRIFVQLAGIHRDDIHLRHERGHGQPLRPAFVQLHGATALVGQFHHVSDEESHVRTRVFFVLGTCISRVDEREGGGK